MRNVITTLAVALSFALLTAGCSKSEETAEPDKEAAAKKDGEAKKDEMAEKTPAKDEAAKKDEAPPSMINEAKNCPASVMGAETEIAEAGGKLVLTIVAGRDGADAEIRALAKKLSAIDPSAVTRPKHTGTGTGGAALGMCPALLPGTTMAMEEVDGGAKITLTPADTSKLASLKTEAEKRLTDLNQMFRSKKDRGSRGHGSGGGQGRGGGHGEGGGEGEANHKGDSDSAGAAKPAADKKDEKKGSGW